MLHYLSAIRFVRRILPLAPVLLLGATYAASALGATGSVSRCHHESDLQSLPIPVDNLTADVVGQVVGQVAIDTNDEKSDTRVMQSPQNNSATPMLYFAPRVAAVLQEVFSAIAIETPGAESATTYGSRTAESIPASNLPLSPLASDSAPSDTSQPINPAAAIEQVETAPSIQRQMFRTDI